jgi:hypothetical protein
MNLYKCRFMQDFREWQDRDLNADTTIFSSVTIGLDNCLFAGGTADSTESSRDRLSPQFADLCAAFGPGVKRVTGPRDRGTRLRSRQRPFRHVPRAMLA